MSKLGLALSGGGFRASLYHLGLVRFLRDAGILPQVTGGAMPMLDLNSLKAAKP